MRKYLMYVSLTKKFKVKSGEKVHHSSLLGELTMSQMAEAQDKPDTWVLIGEEHGKGRR